MVVAITLLLGCLLDFSPHRDVVGASGVKRSTVPVTPAVLEGHPIETCHEVEFSRPGIAMDHRKAPCLAGLADDDLSGREDLAGRVVVLDDQAGEPPTPTASPKAQALLHGAPSPVARCA